MFGFSRVKHDLPITTVATGATPEAAARPGDDDRESATRRALRLVTTAWAFGAAWMFTVQGAAMTRYAKMLGLPQFWFGVFAALPFIGALAQLPAEQRRLLDQGLRRGDIRQLREMYRISPTDGIVAFLTFFMVFVLRADDALFLGILAALILFVRQTVWGAHVSEMGIDRDLNIRWIYPNRLWCEHFVRVNSI